MRQCLLFSFQHPIPSWNPAQLWLPALFSLIPHSSSGSKASSGHGEVSASTVTQVPPLKPRQFQSSFSPDARELLLCSLKMCRDALFPSRNPAEGGTKFSSGRRFPSIGTGLGLSQTSGAESSSDTPDFPPQVSPWPCTPSEPPARPLVVAELWQPGSADKCSPYRSGFVLAQSRVRLPEHGSCPTCCLWDVPAQPRELLGCFGFF